MKPMTAAPAMTAGSREQLLSSWYALVAATPAPADPAAAPAAPSSDTPYVPDEYTPKDDELVTCPNCHKLDDTDAIFCDQCGFKLEGAKGVVVADDDDGDEPAPPGGFADAPAGVANDVVCANPECGHLASGHADAPAGDNTGACQMANCSCGGMQVPGGTDMAQRFAEDDAPPVVDPAPAPAPTTGAPIDTSEAGAPVLSLVGPAFTIPVGIIEGQATQDDRIIEPNALTWRDPPQPLMWLPTTSHGFDSQAGPAVLVGRIEQVKREGDTISATGHLLTTDEGAAFADVLGQMGRLGISADVADTEIEIALPDVIVGEDGTFADPVDVDAVPMQTLTKGCLMGFTSCMHPAFPGAYIVLGDGTEVDASIPMEAPTPEQAAMGIHILSEHDCEPCREGFVELVASAAPAAPPRSWFEMAEPEQITPLTVTDDGQVFGHLAAWGTCHVGFSGQCVTPPHSPSGYSAFQRGYVRCDDGTDVATGPMTVGTVHAGLRLSPAGTKKHYEDTGTAAADIAVSDGVHGIWACGALRPWATAEQIRLLRAAPPSGDWRKQMGALELVAVLNVNTPGFPVPRALAASGEVRSLVAAGVAPIIALRREEEGLDPAARFDRLEAMFRSMAPLAAQSLRDRFAKAG